VKSHKYSSEIFIHKKKIKEKKKKKKEKKKKEEDEEKKKKKEEEEEEEDVDYSVLYKTQLQESAHMILSKYLRCH
jgi:hypothetical protein